MPLIRPLSQLDENTQKFWSEVPDFDLKNCLVDEKGDKISSTYEGRQYKIISKYIKPFSSCEITTRKIAAVVLTVFTLFIALFFNAPQDLWNKKQSTLYFSDLHQKSAAEIQSDNLKSVAELESGMDISQETISLIERNFKNILENREVPGVEQYYGSYNHAIFSVKSNPNLIFKTKVDPLTKVWGRDDSMKGRFASMVRSLNICRDLGLDKLKIPHAKVIYIKYEGQDYEILVEEKLDIDSDRDTLYNIYQEKFSHLTTAINQLALFIIKSGFSDVKRSNIPVLKSSMNQDQWVVALPDLEELDDPSVGLYGNYDRTGLTRCIHESQRANVVALGNMHGVEMTESQKERYMLSSF